MRESTDGTRDVFDSESIFAAPGITERSGWGALQDRDVTWCVHVSGCLLSQKNSLYFVILLNQAQNTQDRILKNVNDSFEKRQ